MSRPKVAPNIKTSMCAVDSPVAPGLVMRRAARRARHTIRGHRVCSKWSGPVTGSWVLCSKTYYCFGATDKYCNKRLSKRHNDIDKHAFLQLLTNRRSGSGNNRGFRVRHSTVLKRAALTFFYAKGVVHEDGVTTCRVDV